MDWNGDGKHDQRDDDFFYNVILPEQEEAENQSSQNASSNFEITPPGGLVIGLTIVMCIAALFMGYIRAIGTLLGLGFIAFLLVNSLFS